MNVPKIQSATPRDGHSLEVEFTNGQRKIYDIRRLSEKELFAPLRNGAFFKNVSVEPGGYAVSWGAEIDISEYELWRNGVEMP